MSKRFERYIDAEGFYASDAVVRKRKADGFGICIWYGFDNCGHTVKHILDLYEVVKAEYPSKRPEDVEVWVIDPSLSVRHAHQTLLRVSIPVEDFIKLRQEGKLNIL